MGFVDEEVVDAGLLEAHAVVLGLGRQQPLVGLLQLGDAALQALDAQALAGAGLAEGQPAALELLAQVCRPQMGAQGDATEARLGEDDGVPVAGGAASHELLAPLLGQSVPVGDEDPSRRVQLEPLPGELVEHVVGHHHRRLGGQAQAAQLHGRHDHGGGLAGAHGVGQQRPAVGENAGHRVALVGMRGEVLGQPGEAQVRPVMGGDDHAAEQLVVALG